MSREVRTVHRTVAAPLLPLKVLPVRSFPQNNLGDGLELHERGAFVDFPDLRVAENFSAG